MITAFIGGMCTGIGVVELKIWFDIMKYNTFHEFFKIKEWYFHFIAMMIFVVTQFKYLTNIISLYS